MISQEILKSIDVSEIINPILEKNINVEKGRYTLFSTGKRDILFPNKENEFPWLLNNHTNNVLKASLWGNGSDYRYWYVKYKTGKHSHINCHSLIASAFLENDNPKLKKIVLHLNDKKYDYRLCNLKWGSYKENNRKFKDGSKVKKREQAIINKNKL